MRGAVITMTKKNPLRGLGTHHLSMIQIALAIAVSGLYVGCERVPNLIAYRVSRTMDESRAMQSAAPILVVGTIGPDDPIGKREQSPWDPILWLQLHRMQIQVENSLRGSLKPKSTVSPYYFMVASSYEGPRPLGDWRMGKRRLFYIREDNGVLRLACDFSNHCAFTVGTGAHPDFKPKPNQPLDAVLADLYFTRGKGVSDLEFADAIPRYGTGMSRQYAVPKLQLLAASTNQDIHEAACYTLACLAKLHHKPSNKKEKT